MKHLHYILFIALGLLSFNNAVSQMQMGISHDNVNVTENIRFNPAHSVDPVPWIDIHTFGLDVFFGSNAAYLDAESFNPFKGELPGSLSQNYEIDKVKGQVEANITGPGINVSLGKFSIGLNSAFRNFAIGRNIPQEFAQGLIYGLRIPEYYGDTLTGDNYRVKAVSFIEAGVHGGMILHQKGNNMLNIGINLKYMIGIGGISFLADNYSYSMTDSTDATAVNYSGKYGGADFGFHPGTGLGVDIGIVYQKKVSPVRYYRPHSPKSNCKYVDYKYKIGFSILDLGYLNYTGSYYREAENANGAWPDYANTRTGNVGEVINQFDAIFENGITESQSSFRTALPLSFALQYDHNFGRGLFINGTLVYGVPFKNSFGAERASVIAITPRFEGIHFGISMPLSYNSMGNAGLGLGLRFWYITLGTDNIGSYLINTDVYRLDVYAHIKVPIFVNTQCRRRGLGQHNWKFSDCSAPGAKSSRKKRK